MTGFPKTLGYRDTTESQSTAWWKRMTVLPSSLPPSQQRSLLVWLQSVVATGPAQDPTPRAVREAWLHRLDAYNRSLKGQPAPVIDGLTGLQRFFISYSISWRNQYHDELLKVLLRTDEHAPARFRVLLPLANMPAFLDAFGVQKGDAMFRAPEDRAEVW